MLSKTLLKVYNFFYKKINNQKKNELLNSKVYQIEIGLKFQFDFLKNTFKVQKEAIVNIGNTVQFKDYCSIWVDENSKLVIGNNVFFNNYCSLNSLKGIYIGDYTIFGEGVKLFDHNHKILGMNEILQNQGCSLGEIHIGTNCWIGSNVTILKNVTIGDNVVIGAGNLIFKNIPSNVIIKQSVNKIIEQRF